MARVEQSNEWFREAYWQFALGLKWKACAFMLRQIAGERASAANSLADEVHRRVLVPFLKFEWIKGTRDILEGLSKRWKNDQDAARDARDLPRRVFSPSSGWERLCGGSPDYGITFDDNLADFFKQCCKAAQERKPRGAASDWLESDGPPPISGLESLWCPQRQEVLERWVAEGMSLLEWRPLGKKLRDLCKQANDAAKWRAVVEKCATIESDLPLRQGLSQFLHLLMLRDPMERQLLKNVSDLIAAVRELDSRRDPGSPQAGDACGDLGTLVDLADELLTERPLDWPPQAIASLSKAFSAEVHEFGKKLEAAIAEQEQELPQEVRDLADRPQDQYARTARLWLVERVVDAIQKTPSFGPKEWETVRNWILTLLKIPDENIRLLSSEQLANQAPDGHVRAISARTDPPPRLKQVGVVVVENGEEIVLRKAELVKAGDVDEFLAELLQLAEFIEPQPRGDAWTVRLCRELGKSLGQCDTLEKWWSAKTTSATDRGKLWMLGQRLCLLNSIYADEAKARLIVEAPLQRLVTNKFLFRDVESLPEGTNRQGMWFTTPAPLREPTDALGHMVRGPVMLLPNGKGFGHCAWLVLADNVARPEPGEVWQTLAELLLEDVGSPCLDASRELALALADSGNRDRAIAAAFQLIRAARGRHAELRKPSAVAGARSSDSTARDIAGANSLAAMYARLVAQLHAWLKRQFGEWWPPLENVTLQQRLTLRPPREIEITPVEGNEGSRGILLDLGLSSDGKFRPVLKASYGSTMPEEVAPWWDLSSPPEFGAATAPRPLLDLHSDLPALAVCSGYARDRLPKYKNEFESWVRKEGLAWFDALVKTAIDDAKASRSSAARDWLRTLRGQKWCRCYPDFNEETSEICWPHRSDDPAFGFSNLYLRSGEDTRLWSVIKVGKYAPAPDLAECTLGVGSELPGSSLWHARKFLKLSNEFKGCGTAGHELHKQAGQFYRASCEAVLGLPHPPVEQQERLVRFTLPALIALSQVGDKSPDGAAALLDQLLEHLRHYCKLDLNELEITPAKWTFSRYVQLDDLDGADCVAARPRFGSDPKWQITLRSFGLVRKGACLDDCDLDLSVCVGASPKQYGDLCKLAGENDEFAAAMRKLLEQWPVKALQREKGLELAATDLFAAFWGQERAWREKNPEACASFKSLLRQLLQDELRMKVVYAKKEDEGKPWFKVREDRGGGEFECVSPALLTADDRVKVVALVDWV